MAAGRSPGPSVPSRAPYALSPLVQDPTDAELVRAGKSGDRAAFSALVERYGGQILSALRTRLGPSDRVHDVAQEAWIRVARGLHTFRDGAAFRPWLFAVVFNAMRDEVRRLSRGPAALPLRDDSGQDEHGGVEHQGFEQVDAADAIYAALREVPEPFREALHLVDLLGLPYDEAASALGCAEGTAKSRVHRGRRLFSEHYLRLVGDPGEHLSSTGEST